MSPEERLKIVEELQSITEQQISNRQKSLELSKELETDISNEEAKLDLLKLELENMTLFKRSKELTSKL